MKRVETWWFKSCRRKGYVGTGKRVPGMYHIAADNGYESKHRTATTKKEAVEETKTCTVRFHTTRYSETCMTDISTFSVRALWIIWKRTSKMEERMWVVGPGSDRGGGGKMLGSAYQVEQTNRS
eukprot:COSAG05_NODE_460_length_9597_cov_8.288798_7_plen_124_part_00